MQASAKSSQVSSQKKFHLSKTFDRVLNAPLFVTFTAQKVCLFEVILVRIFPYEYLLNISVRMRENADQNNSEYGHFSRSDEYCQDNK